MENINFGSLLGKEVMILSTVLHPKDPLAVTIRGVDYGGVWVEAQTVTNNFLKSVNQQMYEGTPITYVPFWRISLAITGRDVPAISSEGISQ